MQGGKAKTRNRKMVQALEAAGFDSDLGDAESFAKKLRVELDKVGLWVGFCPGPRKARQRILWSK